MQTAADTATATAGTATPTDRQNRPTGGSTGHRAVPIATNEYGQNDAVSDKPERSPEQPDVESGLDVGLGVAAVARRLGMAAATLRTWDRRYGIGPSLHQTGTHRRYHAADLARLVLMRQLILEGVTPADAARAALQADVSTRRPVPPAGRALRRRLPRVTSGRTGGGRVVAVRDASPAARGLARAAMALDGAACTAIITTSISRRGVLKTWDDLILPVLTGVGERWRATGAGVDVEHLLSECVEDCLRAVTRTLDDPLETPPVLLAALDLEEHRLPLHAVAAGLAERSVRARMLGARLPVGALSDAMTRTGAAVVFLWAQGASGMSPPRAEDLDGLPALRPMPLLLLGGPGWRPHELPTQSRWVGELGSAVDAILDGAGVGRTGAPLVLP
jgi:transposase-like protein